MGWLCFDDGDGSRHSDFSHEPDESDGSGAGSALEGSEDSRHPDFPPDKSGGSDAGVELDLIWTMIKEANGYLSISDCSGFQAGLLHGLECCVFKVNNGAVELSDGF